MVFKGQVFKYGNNIDTDVIIPSSYLITKDMRELAEHCMEGIDEDFPISVKHGDIIVGGSNFGCGSSREQAVLAILGCGIKLIAAKSFSRIFYRNCINRGICPLEISDTIFNSIEKKDLIEIDVEKGILKNITSCENFSFKPVEKRIVELVKKEGIFSELREALKSKKI